ncbi:MAG: endonuclease V, partial [Proteobacteria bacterium]|nr:endonuclease V [Pseudomonadota bacterium]
LQIIEIAEAKSEITIPYQPGFLSFRELPLISLALTQLKNKPDLIIADGQGIAHPRRFGLASHLGLAFDIPTIGCGKSRLYGKAELPGNKRGDFSYLYNFKKEIIGLVLRTRTNVKPLYISVGHKANVNAAKDWILKLAPQYRLPLTTKFADNLAKLYKERVIKEK